MSQETAALLTELVTSGTMPSRRNLRSWWDRTKKRMGLEDDQDFMLHTCRHTRANRLFDAGINIFVIKEWMGHNRIETGSEEQRGGIDRIGTCRSRGSADQ